MDKNTFANTDCTTTLKRYHEIKPFSCKYCDNSFLQVHEVKEHIRKMHAFIFKATVLEGKEQNRKAKKTKHKRFYSV